MITSVTSYYASARTKKELIQMSSRREVEGKHQEEVAKYKQQLEEVEREKEEVEREKEKLQIDLEEEEREIKKKIYSQLVQKLLKHKASKEDESVKLLLDELSKEG